VAVGAGTEQGARFSMPLLGASASPTLVLLPNPCGTMVSRGCRRFRALAAARAGPNGRSSGAVALPPICPYKRAIPQADVAVLFEGLLRWPDPKGTGPYCSPRLQPGLRMSLPEYTMRSLLEAGAHFGHQSHRWNPKMSPYIFGTRNNIHIIDLAQTVPMLHRALQAVSDTVAKGGRVLFVGTKRQAADQIADAAKRSAQYYVNSRWLGGMLTNWKTISASIGRLKKLEEMLNAGAIGLTKKERLMMSRERDKLEKALGGIKDMGGVPDLIFVIDTNKEQLALKEAARLHIPVAAVVDTNCDPDGINYPVPANDDAGRAIAMYCDLVARAAIDGISRAQGSLGHDTGADETPLAEDLPARAASAEPAPAGEAFELLTAPRGAPDDFSKLQGAGPQIVKKLNDAGIFHFWQLAAMTADDVKRVDHDLKLGGRITRDNLVNQARTLVAGAS
jgi:small subunit ribosomal protein S2